MAQRLYEIYDFMLIVQAWTIYEYNNYGQLYSW